MSKRWILLALCVSLTATSSSSLAAEPAAPPSATLRITVDNLLEALYVNGQPVPVDPESAGDWMLTSTVGLVLRPGENVLAIKAVDHGVIAGLLAELRVDDSVLVSGEAWRVHHAAPEGWEQPWSVTEASP